MSKKRFGSSSFLFLTAVLGMAGSAAVSATGNTDMREAATKDSSLEKDDLADLEDNLVEAEVNTKKLLKLIALGLGIAAGTVTAGGVTYYFKDAENRQKFLQAVSNLFGKGKPGEAEIDKAIEVTEKIEKELEKDQTGESGKEQGTEKTVPGNVDDNGNKGEVQSLTDVPGSSAKKDNGNNGEVQNPTDVPGSSVKEVNKGNKFSNFVHDKFYGLTRDKIMSILPIIKKRLALSKASEEDLKLIDRYMFFLGKNAFGSQTFFAVLKILHLVLVILNIVITIRNSLGAFKFLGNGIYGIFKKGKDGVEGEKKDETEGKEDDVKEVSVNWKKIKSYTGATFQILGRLALDFTGIVIPGVSLGELAVSVWQSRLFKEGVLEKIYSWFNKDGKKEIIYSGPQREDTFRDNKGDVDETAAQTTNAVSSDK